MVQNNSGWEGLVNELIESGRDAQEIGEARISQFLQDTYGYSRVESFLENPREGLHLDGTVMGTFGRGNPLKGSGHETQAWRREYPLISKVHESSELVTPDSKVARREYFQDQNRGGKDFRRLGRLKEEIMRRKYFVSHSAAFIGQTSGQVKELAEKIHDSFPESTLDYSPQNGFSLFVSEPDFCFYSSGLRDKRSAKIVAVTFNSDQYLVDQVNRLVRGYESLMRTISRKR